MGNRESSFLTPERQRLGNYGAIPQQDEDQLSTPSDWSGSEYPSTRQRKIALSGILLCQLFLFVAIRILINWIPTTLQLNEQWWNNENPMSSSYISR